jgi:hypothetical protein
VRRIAYVAMAVVAFGLLLVTGDVVPIASGGFVLGAALLGAFIATSQERQKTQGTRAEDL